MYVDIDDIAVRQTREVIAAQRRRESVGVILVSALEPEPEPILKHPDTARLIDLGGRVGIVTMALVHFFLPVWYESMPAAFRNAVALGSYFVMTHGTWDGRTTDVIERTEKVYAMTPTPSYLRRSSRFFRGCKWWNQGL